MTELETQFANMQDELIQAKRDLAAAERTYGHLKKQFFEAGERYKTNLRAIHFLLTELQTVGTHHEKEVVIRYIKQVIAKHINTDICYYPEADDLPF